MDYVVSISQDNYGRWYVEAELHGQRRSPLRCLTKRDAEDGARRLEQAFERQFPRRRAA
jgi:hypothetical protein